MVSRLSGCFDKLTRGNIETTFETASSALNYRRKNDIKEKEDFVKRLQIRRSSFDQLQECSYQKILTLPFNNLAKVQF